MSATTSDPLASANSVDLSDKYRHTKSLLGEKIVNTAVFKKVFRMVRDPRSDQLRDLQDQDDPSLSKPKIYTCERVALSDDQIMLPDTERNAMSSTSPPLPPPPQEPEQQDAQGGYEDCQSDDGSRVAKNYPVREQEIMTKVGGVVVWVHGNA